jgi:dihydrofolate reductase
MMRKLVVTENVSLDGVIEASEGWFGPTGSSDGIDYSDVDQALRDQREAADAIVLGRVTFIQMRDYWSTLSEDKTGNAAYLNAVSKYVFSSTMETPEWERTIVLKGDLRDEIQHLKSLPGKDIVATGSIKLVHGLIDSSLVDEYRLFVYPTVVGRGKRLFTTSVDIEKMKLLETRQFNSGVVLLRYQTN